MLLSLFPVNNYVEASLRLINMRLVSNLTLEFAITGICGSIKFVSPNVFLSVKEEIGSMCSWAKEGSGSKSMKIPAPSLLRSKRY